MRMSGKMLSSAMALAAFAPAFAPDTAYAQAKIDGQESRAGELAKQLHDPMTQYAVAGALSAMSNILLDMKIEPLVRVMESAGAGTVRDLPADATLRDMAGPGADRAQNEIVDKIPEMMGRMGAMAGAFDEMMPELERMARRMRDAIPKY